MGKVTLRERGIAFGKHVLFSVGLLLLALGIVFGLWYPPDLLQATSIKNFLLVMLGVDLVLGPVLTFIVYKHERKKLLFDLSVILLVQLLAYGYGLWSMAKSRPVWLAFVVDDFELVRQSDVYQPERLPPQSPYRMSYARGPQWVVANFSTDPAIRNQQRSDEMFNGISLARRPETYAPIGSAQARILKKIHPLEGLKTYNPPAVVDRLKQQHPEATGWLPLKGISRDLVVLINQQGAPVDVVALNPWD